MKKIPRYALSVDEPLGPYDSEDGDWCKWEDVEVFQKENDELRAKALAAVWLLPEHVGIPELLNLREEAREVFMGKDKATIAKLEDELRHAQEYARYLQRPSIPSVNAVYGVQRRNKVAEIRYCLMLTSIATAPNGGLEIEVQLP